MTDTVRILPISRLPTEEALLAYVDGQLDPEERAQVEGYLARHPAEARRIEAYLRQARLMHASYDAVYAQPLPPSILESTARLERELRRRPLRRRLAPIAAGFLLAALVGGLGWQGYRHMAEPELRTVLHGYLQQGVRLAFDPATPAEDGLPVRLEALPGPTPVPDGNGGDSAGAPNLQDFGLQLVSARMLSGEGPGAMELVYESEARARVMLYFSPSETAVSSRMAMLQEGSLSLLFWNQQGRSFGLISELGRDELLAIGAAVQEAWKNQPMPGRSEEPPLPAPEPGEGTSDAEAPDTSAS